MKKFNIRLFLNLFLITFVFLSSSCQKKGDKSIDPEFAKYIAAFTFGSVSSSSVIQIELTQDMPAVELEKEIDQELFEFSPSIKGKAYWTSTRKIRFVPEAGELKSGQEYHAWFNLDKLIKVESKFEEFYFYFNIPKQNFNVDVLPYSPTKDNDLTFNTVQGTLTLADDAPIDKIEKMLSVSGNSNKAKITVIPTEQRGVYKFVIDSLKRGNTPVDYVLSVDGKQIEVDRIEKSVTSIPKIGGKNFSVIDVRVTHEPQECIRITFSDPLSTNQNIQGLVKPNGIENFSYDIQKNVLKLFLEGTASITSLDLDIFSELKSFEDKNLDKNYNYQLALEKTKPEIELLNTTGNILPNSENLILPFKSVNLWAVDLKIVKIFENNILGYLQSNDFGGSNDLRRFGRLVLKKRIRLDTDHSMRLDQWNNFSIDLATLIKQDPGAIYRVELSMKEEYSLYPCEGIIPQIPQDASIERFDRNNLSEEDEAAWDVPSGYYYDNDTDWNEYNWSDRDDPCKATFYMNKKSETIVFSSNMGIIAKMGSDKKVMVAVSDILSTDPVSGAVVNVFNFQMQKIGSGKTGGDGFASIDYKGGVPFAIIVSKDKERGYLKMTSNLSLSLSNFDVSGKEIQKGLKGYIYGERGVWRPGDMMYLTFILEDKDKTLPKDHPVSLEIFTPRGQLFQKYMTTSNQDGFYTFQVQTNSASETGNWQAAIKVGGATFHKTLKVETVKPNRLKIRLDAGDIMDASKGVFSSSLSSQWLHGAPATNLKAKVEMTLSTTANPFKGYEAYSFNNPATSFNSDTYTLFDGRLDAGGNATVNAKTPQASNAPGMLKAHIISQVFESGGDASAFSQTAAYSPFSSYVGVKSPNERDRDWLETDTDNVLDIVSLNKDGKLINRSDINVKVYKLNWSWWWSNDHNNLSSYVNSTSAKIVLDENTSTSGGKSKVKLRIDYPEWGRYLVLVKDNQSGHTTGKILYIDWPAYRGKSAKDDPSGLSMLSFSTDKNSYNLGDKVTVTLPKSSNGRALISIENGSKVISREWVKTTAKEDTKHTFTVTEEMNPNFYIFATQLQPHAQTDNDLPIRMYGVLNIDVKNDKTVLNPVITMANELRPEKEFTVSVSEKNKKKMTYTLAIVDEGLLDLTSFKTPNAWQDFYSKQALGVRTWDMFDMVVGATTGKMGPLLSIGGDEALNPSSNPFSRFKPVVKFLGPFTSKGETKQHKITLPSYIGSVRVMVVAGTADGAYGASEKAVPVRNPLMVLSTLPRVAGPSEDIMLPVNIFAMDKKVKNVTVTVKSTGLLQLTDGSSKSVTFTETGDKMVFFKLKAAAKTGYEKIEIKASGGGEVSTETITIEVRNPNPPVVQTSQALVSSNETKELSISMDDPQAEDWVKLEISRVPSIDLSKNLAYLHDYPHGCSEQVTSRVLPLLYVKNFRDFSEKETEKMKYNINEGIKIISSRQLGDGGIAYWPGDHYPTEWVTTYAGHFLIEAQKAGHNVPASVITKWKQFQKKAAQGWNRRDLYSSYYSYLMSDLQQAYRLYTLALAGEPELGAMNRLKEMKELSVQARWRLAATYIIAGKKDAANQLISNVSDNVDGYSVSNNTYGDSNRDLSMIMETYLLLGRTDKALALARDVSKALSGNYISTQSASFGLMAMSKLADKMGKGAIDFDWTLNGVSQPKMASGLVFKEITIKPSENINIHLTNKSQGELHVRLIGRSKPLVDKTPAFTNGMNLYIKYSDLNGSEMNITKLKQGTEFYANIIVQNISGEFLTDIALTQIFASGWEIFNNRLFGNDESVKPFNYQDIRDDRVLTYFNLRNGYSSSFRVRLQAAYCGRFYLPAVACEAMYKPDTQSKTQGQWVEVIQ